MNRVDSLKSGIDAMCESMSQPEFPSVMAGRIGNAVRTHDSIRSTDEIRVYEKSPLLGRNKKRMYVTMDSSTSVTSSPLSVTLGVSKEISELSLGVWIVPALCCALAYAFYNIFIKLGSASINPVLGGVILQFVAAMLGVCLLSVLMIKEGMSVITYDFEGIVWSMAAGVAVGIAEMLSFVVSGMGVPVTQSIPIIIGGSVLFGSILGLVMLHEVLTLHGWFGVILLILGIYFVATDPGNQTSD